MTGLAITLVFVFLAIFGPYLAPYAYQQQDLRRTNELPSMDHWLGTDGLGRDFLSRVLWGARTAIIVAAFVTSISVTLGILLGGVAAYLGGQLKEHCDAATDAFNRIYGLDKCKSEPQP